MARFVVQLHAAHTLHYDFRLEVDGVLVSWALPKGPSLSPRVRRLAVRVGDHELAHTDFEGVLPRSTSGRGGVIIWDRGTWQPDGDGRDAIAAGKLAFTLAGEKLRGRWHLVRTRPRGAQDAWLLFKARDAEADDTIDIVATRPASVISGRTIDQMYTARTPGAAVD